LYSAIVHGWHNAKAIATGFADPSYGSLFSSFDTRKFNFSETP
jgi:hypothetical protein